MQVREARREDLPAIVALIADDQLGQHRENPAEPSIHEYQTAFDAIDADPNNLLVVLSDGDEVVGTLQLTFMPYLTFRGSWRAQIEAVRVSGRRRGEGLGRRMIEWAIEEAERRRCHLIQLTTNKQRDAHRFYESLGFEATHEGMKRYLRGDVHGA